MIFMKAYHSFFCMFVWLASCMPEHDSPNPQASTSIKESKERGVFRFKLDTNKKTLTVDIQQIVIEEVWVEDIWYHDKSRHTNGKQIVIKVQNSDSMDTFLSTWGLGLAGTTYGISNGNISIHIDHDSVNISTLYLYEYPEKYNRRSRRIIDSLRLERSPQ